MNSNIDNLKNLIERIKTISFWGRIFHWKIIREKLVDAVADLQSLISEENNIREQYSEVKSKNIEIANNLSALKESLIQKDGDLDRLNSTIAKNNIEINRLTGELSAATSTVKSQLLSVTQLQNEKNILSERNTNFIAENNQLKENLAQYIANEETRKQDHSKAVATLNNIQAQIQADRTSEKDERHNKEIERLNNMKLTWSTHQENVKKAIKAICSKHTVEYVEQVPFKGDPDNTLKIADEYIIFDAKSPRGDDLGNFSNYLSEQTEKAKKYAKEEDVKKWIFFVVPSNTFTVLKKFVYSLGDYEVFIITVDSLEPIILSLQRIEDYEFAEQLSPEERENICRVLGRFAHLTKRRIQIDTYFIKQFIELAYKSENDLPADILEKVKEFEKSEKLNPPLEKRAKAISTNDLVKNFTKIKDETANQGIAAPNDTLSDKLDELPLYTEEKK